MKHKFSKTINKEFSQVLKKRVNAYFKENNIKKTGDFGMVGKTILFVSLYLGLYFTLILAPITNFFVMMAIFAAIGVMTAIIGTSVMHDGLHGSYTNSKTLNNLLHLSAYILGVNPRMWIIQHNMLHHTYTNIEHVDEDIETRFVLRFTPHQPRRKFHRFQHLYAPFLYGLMTLIWVTNKDFSKLFDYRKKGLVQKGKEFNRLLAIIIVQKIFIHLALLVVPIMVLPFSFWQIFSCWLLMHFIAGLSLGLIFQVAHVMPTSKYIDQEEELIEENWWAHQLQTTANYGNGSRLLTAVIGGLNHQIEHHLFPNICHVHYPKIAPIVEQTSKEYGMPYVHNKTFLKAIRIHFKQLKTLGRYDSLEGAN